MGGFSARETASGLACLAVAECEARSFDRLRTGLAATVFIAPGTMPGRDHAKAAMCEIVVQGCTAAEAQSADARKRGAASLRPFAIWVRQDAAWVCEGVNNCMIAAQGCAAREGAIAP
ncbi:MAG: hypothetical protein BGP23_03985 [Lysobacterales bacterium 66-474]|nr:MAG: hypothetical protein ABT18_12215 [Rhodanobacter sp. SCN 66-43]OJY85842.1 MAG: hypothetical protein BGP23_03985 [Xanthomonadales bacterium 66-474]